MDRYNNLRKLSGNLEIETLEFKDYKNIIVEFAKTHETESVKSFNRLIKAVINHAIDEGVVVITKQKIIA